MKKLTNIALVGSTNAGKSTLFNTLTNSYRSITSPLRGVTRDIISTECLIRGNKVLLSDTGGIKNENEPFDAIVKEKSISLLRDADIVLFVVDSKNITPEDEEIFSLVQPYKDKTILCVNKIDNEKQDNDLWNFYKYGIQRVVGISALHKRGISELEEFIISLLNTDVSSQEEEIEDKENNTITVSIMGKPNTGKSTLINYLLEKDISIVSPVSGTTRDTVIGQTNRFGVKLKFIDTAGIRRKTKVQEDVEYYSVNRAIKSIDEADVVLLVISADIDISEQDKKIASLVTERGKSLLLVINKSDLWNINGQKTAYIERLKFLFPVLSYAPIITTSALNKNGAEELIKKIKMLYKESNKRVSTSEFNEKLKVWKEMSSPRRSAKGVHKILYGTQVSAHPVEFTLFVNKKEGFPDNYISYIKNKIRTELGFTHIPIKITLKGRGND